MRDLTTRMVVLAARCDQNMERTLLGRKVAHEDASVVLARLEQFAWKGTEIMEGVVPSNSYISWECVSFRVEIRPEEDEFQVAVWHADDEIRNSGYVKTIGQVIMICANLGSDDLISAMRILFASHGDVTRDETSLAAVVRKSLTQSTVSILED